MAQKREQRPARKMKPVFLVFCEGETEETYLDFLRRTYKSPIKIIAKTEGDSISQRLINKRKKEISISKNEQVATFLMYDLDVTDINKKLKECNATWLCSNPCIELWFLLHCQNQKKTISTNTCINQLSKIGGSWEQYEKPNLTQTQKQYLWDHRAEAVQRAKQLAENQNPSSSIYKLLEFIEDHSK